jgi:hypothetical protein
MENEPDRGPRRKVMILAGLDSDLDAFADALMGLASEDPESPSDGDTDDSGEGPIETG